MNRVTAVASALAALIGCARGTDVGNPVITKVVRIELGSNDLEKVSLGSSASRSRYQVTRAELRWDSLTLYAAESCSDFQDLGGEDLEERLAEAKSFRVDIDLEGNLVDGSLEKEVLISDQRYCAARLHFDALAGKKSTSADLIFENKEQNVEGTSKGSFLWTFVKEDLLKEDTLTFAADAVAWLDLVKERLPETPPLRADIGGADLERGVAVVLGNKSIFETQNEDAPPNLVGEAEIQINRMIPDLDSATVQAIFINGPNPTGTETPSDACWTRSVDETSVCTRFVFPPGCEFPDSTFIDAGTIDVDVGAQGIRLNYANSATGYPSQNTPIPVLSPGTTVSATNSGAGTVPVFDLSVATPGTPTGFTVPSILSLGENYAVSWQAPLQTAPGRVNIDLSGASTEGGAISITCNQPLGNGNLSVPANLVSDFAPGAGAATVFVDNKSTTELSVTGGIYRVSMTVNDLAANEILLVQ